MRPISLTKRQSDDAITSAEVEVVLICVNHATLEKPIRLSSDPTERLSHDPLIYCTRSTWLTANPMADPFLYAPMAVDRPHDQKGVPAAARLMLSNLDPSIVALLRSVNDRATVDMAIVLASSPNYVQDQVLGLKLVDHGINATDITLSISRAWKGDEPWPAGRMTRFVLPGLHL